MTDSLMWVTFNMFNISPDLSNFFEEHIQHFPGFVKVESRNREMLNVFFFEKCLKQGNVTCGAAAARFCGRSDHGTLSFEILRRDLRPSNPPKRAPRVFSGYFFHLQRLFLFGGYLKFNNL